MKKVLILSLFLGLIASLYLTLFAMPVSSANQLPFGYLDSATEENISGWAYDPDKGEAPIDVHIYIDGKFAGSVVADDYRPDVPQNTPSVRGEYHGFNWKPPTLGSGIHPVRAHAINYPPGDNPLLTNEKWILITAPEFFSSNLEYDRLLNEFFYRHFSAWHGPSAFTGDQQTDWREWNALSSLWIDTSVNKVWSTANKPSVYGTGWPVDDRHDYNAELKIALERVRMDDNGYVWMYGGVGRGWPFPTPECKSDTETNCYDTRHPVTNTSFILASHLYFNWTGDISFLKRNIARIRKAMHFLQTDLNGDRYWVIENHWRGHDGLVGEGHGLGSNYWDILPFGWRDAYATIQYYASLNAMAEIEKAVEARPEWNIPPNPYGEKSANFRSKAATVKNIAGNYFWNDNPGENPGAPETKTFKTGRFFGTVDKNGGIHDFGFVFLNLEAIYYGFANDTQADTIYKWLDGELIYPIDTSRGQDIYHWRFAPRAGTKNNTEWYYWDWHGPYGNDTFPFGEQVQDGGTSLHLSYFDLMNRLRYRGADDAYSRLKSILNWYKEVQDYGGYRQYYQDHEGKLQGCGTPGGLGIDCEFVESTLVPTTFLYGLLGVEAKIDGLHIKPNLPSSLSFAGVDNLFWQGNYYKITGSKEVNQSSSSAANGKYEIVVKNGEEFIIPFGQTPSNTISLSSGWNQIIWPDVSGKKASDVPPECPIAVAKENFWFKPYIKNFGGVNFNFENGKTYFIKCNQEVTWNL